MLLLATGVAAALRLMDLGTWSLWIDEAHTWRDATMPLDGDRGFLRSDRALYPLTFLVLRGLRALDWIGGDEFSLRLPFALVGIATVPLLALAGRRLVGAWPAVLAAGLCAINPWHIFWSQNARGYVLVFCFAILAANRAHAHAVTDRLRDLMATLLAIGLGALCHPTGAMQAAGLAAFLVLRRFPALHGRVLVRLVLTVVVVGLLLPWLVTAFAPFQGFLRSKDQPSLLHLLQTTAYYFRPSILLVAAVGLVLAWHSSGRERALLLACLCIVPFVLLVVIGGQVVKVTARYAICTLPVLTLAASFACASVGAAALAGPRRRRATGAVAALLLPLLLAADYGRHTVAYYGDEHGQRARWREACQFALAAAGTAPLRILTVNQPTVTYYLRPLHWSARQDNPYPMIQVMPLLDWMVEKGCDEGEKVVHAPGGANHLRWHVAEAKKVGARFLVMLTLPELEEIDDDRSLWRTLQEEFDLELHLSCWVGPKDESIYVFGPRGD